MHHLGKTTTPPFVVALSVRGVEVHLGCLVVSQKDDLLLLGLMMTWQQQSIDDFFAYLLALYGMS